MVIINNIMNKCLKCGEYMVVYVVCCILSIFICYAFNTEFSIISHEWWIPVVLGIPVASVTCLCAHVCTRSSIRINNVAQV